MNSVNIYLMKTLHIRIISFQLLTAIHTKHILDELIGFHYNDIDVQLSEDS